MADKLLKYDVAMKSTKTVWQMETPICYTGDENTVTFDFNIIDLEEADLVGVIPNVYLYMRDGSFFQKGPADGVEITGTTVNYTMKGNEGKHSGIAKAQLVLVWDDEVNPPEKLTSQMYAFEVVSGLENKVAVEVMIQDWTTLTREARTFIDTSADEVDALKGELQTAITTANTSLGEFDVALQNGIVATNIAAELQNLEATYAPDLVSMKTQLADIAIDVNTFEMLSGETDDTFRLKRAIAYGKANNKNLYFPPKVGGYTISEPLLIDYPCKLIFSGKRSHINQTTWGVPTFDVRSPDVTFEGELYTSYLGVRTMITTAPIPDVSGDPKSYCSGVFLYDDCSRFKAQFIHVHGFVAGITHVGTEMTDLYIDTISFEVVDFGIFGNAVNNPTYKNVIGKNITNSQGEPEHAIYLTKLGTDSQNLYIGSVKVDGLPTGNSALSIRGTNNFKIDSIQCSNVGGLVDLDRAKGVITSIVAECPALILNNRGNITVENSSDVVIDSLVTTSNAVYTDASNKTYAVACSTSSKIAINKSRITLTNATPNTAFYASGHTMRLNMPEIIYQNPLPATIYAISSVSSSICEVINPYMQGASRLFFYAATAVAKLFYNHDRMKTPLERDGISSNILGIFPVTFMGNQNVPVTLQANYAIPYITVGNSFITANTASTTITNFRFGSNYQEFTVYAGDTNTAIQNNSTIVTKTGANIAAGSWKVLKFVFIDGVSYQV